MGVEGDANETRDAATSARTLRPRREALPRRCFVDTPRDAQEGVSIDRETGRGMTALMSAAEEDPGSLGHAWVKNEEGWDVLAVALLLDSHVHRPKVRRKTHA